MSYKFLEKQECIPVGCVPPVGFRMGGLHDRVPPPGHRPPWIVTPWTETPLDRVTASFTPTPKVSWKIEAFSLCMFLLLPTLREVPHGTKGTGPKFVTRPVYSRSQLQEQHEHSFCSSSTNAFISCSLYTVRRYCTSPGAPDLWARLG